jgi:Cupredoxin-like domain
MVLNQKQFDDSKLIVMAVAGTMIFFVLIVVFVGEGFVRQVPIFWKEDIRTTVAFEEIDGQLKVVGLIGNGGTDPTLVMKAGSTPYILTVINQDTKPHMFYVDGLNAHTKVLRAGENDTITLISKNEATYNYYDRFDPEKIIGQIISARVEATD